MLLERLKGKFPKASRRKLISSFIKHRYWFNQGSNTFAAASIVPFEKVALYAAAAKYLLGDHVSPWLLYPALGAYFVWRVCSRWLVGYLWHYSDGYDVETEWNRNKVPPSRVEMINSEELALKVARCLRCDKQHLVECIAKEEGRK